MKFLILYKAPISAMEQMKNASPEDMKKGMEPWMAWGERCGKGLIDMGSPVGNAHSITKSNHGETKSTIAGYSILEADSWKDLKKMLDGHPHIMFMEGAEIEIHEMFPMTM